MRVLLLFVVLTIAACSYSGEFKAVQVAKRYTISLPDYMTENEEGKLNKEATLQYGNYFRNFYIIVLEKPMSRTHSLADYTRDATKELVNSLQKPIQIDSAAVEVNGMPGAQVSMKGIVGVDELNEHIYYRLVFLQGKDRVYQLTLWSWDKNRDKYEEDIKKIIESFKEL